MSVHLFNFLLPLVFLASLAGAVWALGSLLRRKVRQNPQSRTKALLVGGLCLVIAVGLFLNIMLKTR